MKWILTTLLLVFWANHYPATLSNANSRTTCEQAFTPINPTLPAQCPELYDSEAVALLLLKKWEGFTPKSKWDINAERNGYGTAARYPGEVIDRAEADRRARRAYTAARAEIVAAHPDLGEWPVAVLAVMGYNVSRFGPKLQAAIGSGDMVRVAEVMQLYNKAAGVRLQGLANRRAAEAALLLTPPGDREMVAVSLQAELGAV